MPVAASIAALTLLAVLLLMGGEAALSAINERTLRAKGAVPAAHDVLAIMLWAYPACFIAMAIEGARVGPAPPPLLAAGLVLFGLSKTLKMWVMTTLGSRWTFRVLVLPDTPPITHGPYALLRHPNYLAIIGEIIGVAMIVGAPVTGVIAVVGYGALLRRKIAVEDRALGENRRRHMLHRPSPVSLTLRILDLVSVAGLLLALTIFLTGGFREWMPWGRVSMTSWLRPLLLAILGLAIRHWLQPRPTTFSRMAAGTRAAISIPGVRQALPICLSTRAGVLVVGLLAVALIGFRAEAGPPWRAYQHESAQFACALGYRMVSGRRGRRISVAAVAPGSATKHRVLPRLSDVDALHLALSRTRALVVGSARFHGFRSLPRSSTCTASRANASTMTVPARH